MKKLEEIRDTAGEYVKKPDGISSMRTEYIISVKRAEEIS